MSVNVEEIMSGIRAEIQEKGYSSDMLSFADVPQMQMQGSMWNGSMRTCSAATCSISANTTA